MSEQITDTLAALSKLRAGDREAVLKRLSPEERRRLEAHKALALKPKSATPMKREPRRKVLEVSPWLAKHLVKVADARVATTPAAREAVGALLGDDAS